jgi:diguanylate cyclase (GGDEF)-like protein/PAS domain S-box-containing protein
MNTREPSSRNTGGSAANAGTRSVPRDGRWRALVEKSGEALVLVDRDARIQYANPAAMRLLDHANNNVLPGSQLVEFIHSDDRMGVQEALAGCLEDATHRVNFTARLAFGPDASRWIEGTLANTLADDAVGAIVVNLRDISGAHELEERYAAIFSLAPVGIAQMSMDRRLQFVNDALCEIFGYSREELVGHRLKDFSHPEDNEATDEAIARLLSSELKTSSIEKRFVRRDGSIVWAKVTMSTRASDSGGRSLHRIAVIENIDARKKAEQHMLRHVRQEECIARLGRRALGERDVGQLMSIAVEEIAAGLCASDAALYEVAGENGRFVLRAAAGTSNQAGVDIAVAPELLEHFALLGSAEIRRSSHWPLVAKALPGYADKDPRSVIVCPVRVSESRRLVLAAVSGEEAFSGDDANFIEALSSVLSTALQRNESETRLAYLAQFDSLTGLANRSLLRDRLTQALAQATRQRWAVAVLFADLDRFKLVNDNWGHTKGDELLAQTARRLQACVRGGDTVARISGDEFALVLAEMTRPDDAAVVARKVLDALAAPFLLGEHEAAISASVGIAIFPADGDDAETLIKHADTAMYRAKESGRNSYRFFTAEMNQRSQDRLQFANELHRALERQEFRLHYQPKVTLADGRALCGLQATLHWQHAERGLFPPEDFVPSLEETGLIFQVGEWALREACRQVRAWLDAGLCAVPVAVKLCARQFGEMNLDRRVHECASAAGIEARYVELEITEDVLIEDPQSAHRALQALREAGIHVAIEKFGIGYSSLFYLKQFALSAIKFDRSFLRNLDSDANAVSILNAIINIAHSLNFITIADGVAEDRQAQYLRRAGCDQAQGILFAPALAPGALDTWLQPARA